MGKGKAVRRRAGLFRTLKNPFRGPFLADVPPELFACEFECRARECSEERWRSCPNRIRLMNGTFAFAQARQAGCRAETDVPSPEEGGGSALSMKLLRAIP